MVWDIITIREKSQGKAAVAAGARDAFQRENVRAAGFTKCDEKDGILEFLITREQYFRQRADEIAK